MELSKVRAGSLPKLLKISEDGIVKPIEHCLAQLEGTGS